MSQRRSLFGRSRRLGFEGRRRLTVESLETRRLLAIVVHVATDGDDATGDGSENAPFATIGKGILEVDPDGTVIVDAGDYNEAANVNKTFTLNAVGAVTVNSLSSLAANTATLNGNLTADSNFTFNGPVRIATATQLTAPNVLFNNTLNAVNGLPAPALTVTASTLARLGNDANDLVGAVDPLAALSVNGAAANIGAAQIRTSGNTTVFNAPVVLNANLVVTELGAGNVIFASTVNSDATARTLQVNTVGGGLTRFGGDVGVGSALASLTTDAPGLTEVDAATIRTNGIQDYGDDVTISAALTTFRGANLEFSETLNGDGPNRNLLIVTAAGGVTRFLGDVGNDTPLGDLTTSIDSRTEVAGLVETTGTQRYEDPVTVIADATFRGANVRFEATLRASAATNGVLIESPGLTRFGAAVGGGGFRLAGLETDDGGTTEIAGGAVLTVGDQTYGDDVQLTQNTTVTGTNIDFERTVQRGAAAVSLQVDSENNGTTRFGGDVGAEPNRLSSVTTNADGVTILAGVIRTTGSQTYNDDVRLEQNVTLIGATVGLLEDVDTLAAPPAPARGLTISSTTATNLGDAAGDRIGGTNPLASLSISGAGAVNVRAGTIATSGSTITFNSPVVLNTNTVITEAGPGNVTFNSTVNSDATLRTLTVITLGGGDTVFNGRVGASSRLASLTTDTLGAPNGRTVIGTDQINAQGATITFNDPVVLAANTTITEFGAGNVTFNSTVNSDATLRTLNVTTLGGGDTVFNGRVGANSRLASLTTDTLGAPNGRTVIGTDQINAQGPTVTFNDPVVLAANTTITEFGAGAVTFNSTVNSDATLRTLNVTTLGGGDAVFNGRVGTNSRLASLTTDTLGAPNGRTVIGTDQINAQGATITFNDPVVLAANTTISEFGAGNVTFNSTVNSDATLRTLNVTTLGGGDTVFNGRVGTISRLANLTTDTPVAPNGRTLIGTDLIHTEGASITFNDPVVLMADVQITEFGAGPVTFNNIVNSDGTPRALEVLTPAAANTFFNDAIGNNSPLRRLITRAPGLTFLDGPVINILDNAIPAGNDSVLFEDNVTLTGPLAINVTGAGNVHFGGTVLAQGGNHNLNVDTGVGNTLFDGTVGVGGALGNLTTDADGDTIISGGQVVTNGNQLYNDDVIVAATTTFTGANVEFDATLNASANLFDVLVNSGGLTRFGGNVGTAPAPAVVPLINNLTTNIGGTTRVGGTLVRTAGTQTFNDPVTVTNSVAFQGANVRFQETLDADPAGAHDVSVDSPGQTLFRGIVGGVGPLRNLTTDAPGNTDINGGAVTTTQTQTYNDAVVFVSPTNVTTLTGGGVLFNNTLNAGLANQDLILTVSGLTRFGDGVGVDDVGTVLPLIQSITTDAAGTTLINTAEVRTNLDQTYNDPVELGVDVITRSVSGNVYFDQTVDSVAGGSFGLTVFRLSGSRPTIFNGDVGGPANATNDPGNLGHVIVFSNGPLTLVAAINTDEQIAINISEGAVASVTDDLTLAAGAALRAQTNIDLNVGDDITFQPGSSAVADGNLTVVGDFGSNDANVGSTINALGTTGSIGAGGLVSLVGGPDNDFFNIQLARLRPGDAINVNGAGNGAGTFTLITDTATVNATCDPVIAPATSTALPLGDSLNLFDTDQVVGRAYTLNSTQLSRDDGLVVTFTEVQQFELNAGSGNDLLNAIMPGLPSVVQFNGGGGADQLSITGSAGADRITVDVITDVSPHRPFEIANVERLRVRAGDGNDIVVNRVGIPSMLEGQGGNDLLVGNSATDVIFGGAGIDTLIGGDGDDFLFPDHDFDGTLNGIFLPADGDISAGGNGVDGAAPFGALDSVCSIQNLVDGGAQKDVITWLQARILSDVQELMEDAILALNAGGFVLDPPAVAVQFDGPIANPSFEHWLENLYQALLGRDFGPSELAYYQNVFAAGATREGIAQGFLNSPERRGNIIDGWYQRYLGRALDAGGRAYWLNVWAQLDSEAVEAAILGSGEFYQRVGGTNQAWVQAMYSQVLGRTGGNAEVQFWVARAATTSRAVIAKQFVTSDEYRLYAVGRWYQSYLTRAPESGGAQFWLNKLKGGVKAENIQSSILASLEFQQMAW